jgi:hypothetical protein
LSARRFHHGFAPDWLDSAQQFGGYVLYNVRLAETHAGDFISIRFGRFWHRRSNLPVLLWVHRQTRLSPPKELVFPLLDLVEVHVELLGQFHQRLLAPDRCKRHLRLESGVWFRRGRLVMLSCFRRICRAQAEIPLIFVSKLAEPPLGAILPPLLELGQRHEAFKTLLRNKSIGHELPPPFSPPD